MRKLSSLLIIFQILISTAIYAQEAPNVANASELSPTTALGAMAATTDINYFTGIPSVTIPLYSYSGKGMNVNISADYIGGGAKDGQEPSTIGLGWYLDAGGLVTRMVRGVPDDLPTYGFMNAAAIPTDFRSNGNKYYYDSIDAQPDVFIFNFNGRSGKFYIGKDKSIVVVPQSKIKIQYTLDGTSQLIIAFKITTEDGVKYLFNNAESTAQYFKSGNSFNRSAYSGSLHYSAWYLSQIVSPFNTDTIKFAYYAKHLNTTFAYPSTSIVNASTKAQTAFYTATGTNSSDIIKIASITFPDKTQATFEYSNNYQYDDTDYALRKLKISDSVLRKGFQFDYQTSFSGTINKYDAAHDAEITATASYPTNLLLKSITPFTANEITRGYSFFYNIPYPNFHTYANNDSVLSAYDHWGFFNGWGYRQDAIPYVAGINTAGADRSVSNIRVTENALSWMYSPNGGGTHYEYEFNTTRIVTNQLQSASLSVNGSSNINLSQAFSPIHELSFSPNNVDRSGTAPFTGTATVTFNIKSTDGVTLYASTTISLYDLFYLGLKKWSFSVPNGTYRLESSLSGSSTVPANYSNQITWYNKVAGSGNIASGGIRVAKITSQTASDDPDHYIVQEFKYNNPDGNSSGFLGEVPEYYYPYQKIITSPYSITNLNVISSDPLSEMNSAQGSFVGYSHVEVYNGSATKNLGKTVYEFTNLSDVGANYFHATFPYGPNDIKDWGLGLPKRTLVYDSSGNLVQTKTNQYSFNNITYNTNGNFKGLKLGLTATTYATDPDTYPTTNKTNKYLGQEYYIASGRPSLDQTIDSAFYDDGSIQTRSTAFTYDTYYNLIKSTTSYDKTKGLSLETRLYYPYNYTFTSGAIKTLKDSNIITPVISTEKWITGDANPRMVDASVTNFYQLAQKYIVPQHIYAFQNNAPVNQSVIGAFNPATLVRNTTYLVEQKSYPVYYGNGIPAQETNMISGENSAVILDYNLQYPIAKVSNAANSDVAYTSFESDGSGNWTIASGLRDKSSAMTGKQSYNLSNGSVSVTTLNSSNNYVLTGWVKSGATVNINGTSLASITSPISTHNNWNLYSYTFGGLSSLTISGSGLIDELRLYPSNANMITNTYEPNVGVTSTCDANNTIIYTEYDNLNRVKLIRDIDKNILKRYDYSDNSTALNTAPNWIASGKICETGSSNIGKYDSTYTDINPSSDTYNNIMKVFKGYDYCTCTTNPQYKVVNGSCEMGTRVVTGSSRVKVIDQNNNITWEWHCTYHYEWSDNSRSADTTEVHPDSGSSPCYIIDP